VIVEVDGVAGSGQGVSTDILEAGGQAYVRALSNAVRRRAVADQAQDAEAKAPELVRAP
jgi:2-isopropylmalate synthase